MLLPIVSNLPRSHKAVLGDPWSNLRPTATPIATPIVLHGAGHSGQVITIRGSNRQRRIVEAADGAARPRLRSLRVTPQVEALGSVDRSTVTMEVTGMTEPVAPAR